MQVISIYFQVFMQAMVSQVLKRNLKMSALGAHSVCTCSNIYADESGGCLIFHTYVRRISLFEVVPHNHSKPVVCSGLIPKLSVLIM